MGLIGLIGLMGLMRFIGPAALPKLKLTGEMELDMLEVLLSHLQHIVGVGEEHVAAFAVFCHILVFALLECVEFSFVVAFNPTCFV